MFDLAALHAAVQTHGRVARVVIAAFQGSSPREVGAAMLVWGDDKTGGQSGTVGGGALEWQACAEARKRLTNGQNTPHLSREPLGPKLGQCCGGVVTLLTEVYDAQSLARISGDIVARATEGGTAPLAITRILATARNTGVMPPSGMVQGWMIEPIARPQRHIWVWGAGHVGRAIVSVLAPLPDIALTWVDVATNRFPADTPEGVTILPAAEPALLMRHAPQNAQHLILTYSHSLDLALCNAALHHGFSRCGLIGSKTKRARFRSRLASLGHSAASIARIECPIGDITLGKHPQAIAIGVATALLSAPRNTAQQENTG